MRKQSLGWKKNHISNSQHLPGENSSVIHKVTPTLSTKQKGLLPLRVDRQFYLEDGGGLEWTKCGQLGAGDLENSA